MDRLFSIEYVTPLDQQGFPANVSRITYMSGVDGQQDWAFVYPPEKGRSWVVMIHGHGSSGDQLYMRPDVRDNWLPAFRAHGLGILTPNLRDNAWMSPSAADDLHDLLDYMREEYGAEKFYLFSGSMGGTSNLIYAALYPEDATGVVALCPATDLTTYHAWCRERNEGVIKEIADAIVSAYGASPKANPRLFEDYSALLHAQKLTMPVFVSHGTRDDIIPVSESRKLAAAMGDSPNFVYVEIPDGDHDSPLIAQAQTAIDWVLKNS